MRRATKRQSARQSSQSSQRKPGKAAYVAFGATALALAGGATYGFARYAYSRALTLAAEYTDKGFGALAAETIDPYRRRAVKDSRGCQVALGAYFVARQADRLEWAAQSCLNAKIEIIETYLGLAAAREFKGQDREALQLLAQSAAQFEKLPDFHYRMAQILRRLNQHAEATQTYLRTLERSPENNQIAMEALTYLSLQENWSEAGKIAARLKSVPTEDPEVKLVIARALMRSGDTPSAQTVVAEAKAILGRKPASAGSLDSAYADVFAINAPTASTPLAMAAP